MAEVEDPLPAVEEKLLQYVLDRALEPEPGGVPATECNSAVRGDAAASLHHLVYEEGLLAFDEGIYYVTLRAMLRRRTAFAESLEPLQGVLDYGHQVLDDKQRPDKVGNVDDLVGALVARFPSLSMTPVRTRFNWALFGLQPFVEVHQRDWPRRAPLLLLFLPDLYRVSKLDELVREQQVARAEREILRTFREAYARTRRRRALALSLGEDARRDLALRSLVDKGDAEMLDAARVVATDQGLAPDVEAIPWPASPWPSSAEGQEVSSEPGPLEQLLVRLVEAGALTPDFASLLGRDAQEVEICLREGAHKAALILCGSILEGVLVAVLSQNKPRAEAEYKLGKGRQHKAFPDDASLPDLVALASKHDLNEGLGPLLGAVQGDIAKLVAGHRDLVHPHAEVRAEQLPVNRLTATAVHANLCVLLDGLAQRVEDGWAEQYRRA